MMKDSDYTTLAFLAQAVVTAPAQGEDFVAAVRSELADELTTAPELVEALDAIQAHWEALQRQRRPVTLDDIVGVAEQLEQDGSPTHRVAALALISAVQRLLSRKRIENTLTDGERDLAQRLPRLASSAS